MKNILVTGGAGYIGSHIVRELEESGFRAIAYDNLSAGHEWAVLPGRLVVGNIQDTGRLRAVFDYNSIDAVMHMAAHIVVPESLEKPLQYYSNNVLGTLTLLNIMKEFGVNKFIFSSTAAVYGMPEVIPIAEDLSLRPINPYGQSKAMAEQILRDICRAEDFRYVTLRYFNAAGADPLTRIGEGKENATHLITQCLRTAAGTKPALKVYGTDYPTFDGTCIRDYIHVNDLSSAHTEALKYLLNGGASDTFNCGYNQGYSVREVIHAVKQVTGADFPVQYVNRRPGDPPILIADSTKIKKKLGWAPQFNDLHTIIKTAWDWEQKRLAKHKFCQYDGGLFNKS